MREWGFCLCGLLTRLNRESERIMKKTSFLKVEDSLQLAAGIFNKSFRRELKDGTALRFSTMPIELGRFFFRIDFLQGINKVK
jgi:hypothetical protein